VLRNRAGAASPADSVLAQRETPLDGLVVLESVPKGKSVLRVRALGYRAEEIDVAVPSGCTVQVEVYLKVVPTCESNCPAVTVSGYRYHLSPGCLASAGCCRGLPRVPLGS
jgi:hypothetical protein